jgi:5-methylcytosine-specific restriction endonuclease McrA
MDRDPHGKFVCGHSCGLRFGSGQIGHTKPHNEETKEKIRQSKLGKKLSIKHRLNIQRGSPKGKLSHLWKTGKSKEKSYQHYNNSEYKIWRKLVFERDNFTCQHCQKTGVYITAHHIKSWNNYPKVRFVISNGLTLCEDCHKLTDNYKGRGRK